MESSLIVIQGYLKKHSGGIFFATKKRWITLTSDGILSLSKRASQTPYNRIKITDFSDFNSESENLSFTFCSLEDGVLVRAIKFYTLENPTFEEWVTCIQRVRAIAQTNAPPPTPTRQFHFLKQKSLSMKALFHPDEPRDSSSDSDLAQIDPVLKVQAGGESVAKSGYLKKRGGAKGGNRAFKKRWFVVTHFGRVLYFKTSTSSTPLGQFSLIDARFDSLKENEVSITTESRVWELLFESEREKMEWMVILNRIVLDIESDGPGRAAGLSKKINIGEVGLHPRNVSLIQKSTIALGFHQADNDADEELNRINGITRRISGRNHANTMGKWEELSVACVTWNLSESLPKMSDIRFLRRLRTCHVVTIGVQECQSVIYHSFQSDQLSPIDVWLVMLKSVMGDGFTLVASRAMGAIHICVFVRHDIIDCVSNVSTTYVACGIGNVMFNKGAVAVRMNFYDTSVAFICAHLAANKEKLLERRQDYHRIASVIIDNLGKTATYAKMAKELSADDDIRESETIELDFCSTRYQQRRSTFVEVNSNPLVELNHDEDIVFPEIRVKSGVNITSSIKDNKEDDRKNHSSNYVDTGDRLAREFDRCFFFGDLNYRLKAEKPWTQLLLSMSDRMLAVQEEDINLYNMQQASIPPESSEESESNINLVISPSLLSREVRDSELSRNSHEVAKQIDQVVDSCNSASFRLIGKQLKTPTSSPNKFSQAKSSHIVLNSPHTSLKSDASLVESNPEDNSTLQMLANMVPTGDYDSEDEDDDGDILPEDITVVTDVDNLCKVFDNVSNDNDMMDERLSQIIQDYPLNREYSCDISVINNPRNSEAQRMTESSTLKYIQEKKALIFDTFHTPYPLLSSESRRGLQNFVTLTGFTSRESILLRLLELDQLTEERKLGNVFMGFEEGPIRFKPSYKFDPYTDVYDTSKKSRTPSWCDRIFYNIPRYGKEVQLQTYECIHEKFHSDHHPVIAVFKIKV